MPHAPQLLMSPVRSAHTVGAAGGHAVVPVGHDELHFGLPVPLVGSQNDSAGHTLPQPVQLFESVLVLTQVPLQFVRPLPQQMPLS